jgi:hypothetical protein
MRDRSNDRHWRVHRVRAIALGLLRVIAITMITAGLILIANRLLFGLWGTGNIAQGWSNWMGNGQWHGIFFGVPLTGAGIALALLSRWLSHWIVRAPGMGCGRCGYATLDEEERCSECGYR